jgi:hypothetical protein
MHGTSPDYLFVLDIITELIFGEEHKLCSSWCCIYFFVHGISDFVYVKDLTRIQISSDFQSFTKNVTTFVKVLQMI